MKRKKLTFPEEQLLSKLPPASERAAWNPSFSDWIKGLRVALRMTQTELAQRAQITQPHLAGIESGKVDPQFRTLRRIFDALSCDVSITPLPRADIPHILLDRARLIARIRLQRVVGTMAMEGQNAAPEILDQVVERRALEIMNDPGEHLWGRQDD